MTSKIFKGARDLGNAKPTVVLARHFTFFGWRSGGFIFDIFAAAPLAGSSPDLVGVPSKVVKSEARLESDEPALLRIPAASNWHSLRRDSAFVLMATYAPWEELPAEARLPGIYWEYSPTGSFMYFLAQIYGIAEMTGKAGSRFRLKSSAVWGCGDCEGSFADFAGATYPTYPPTYGGPGANGITRMVIGSTSDDKARDSSLQNSQGFTLYAPDPIDFHVDEYAEKVTLPANRGLLTFNGQPFPLSPSVPLKVVFDKSTFGHIEISMGDMADVRLDGVANELYLGDENLMPRRIDGWPWYLQAIFGAVFTLCVERLIPLLSGRGQGQKAQGVIRRRASRLIRQWRRPKAEQLELPFGSSS